MARDALEHDLAHLGNVIAVVRRGRHDLAWIEHGRTKVNLVEWNGVAPRSSVVQLGAQVLEVAAHPHPPAGTERVGVARAGYRTRDVGDGLRADVDHAQSPAVEQREPHGVVAASVLNRGSTS